MRALVSALAHAASVGVPSTPTCMLSTASLRAVAHRLAAAKRTFSSASANAQSGYWKDESPSGGLTELYVFQPEIGIEHWPDPTLGVLSQVDTRFAFPGNVTVPEALGAKRASILSSGPKTSSVELQTSKQSQASVLYSAHDYIHNTSGAEEQLCSDLLVEFPEMRGADRLRCEMHEAPLLLKKDVQSLFPGKDITSGHLSVITMAQKTDNDMSMWSDAMEDEREALTEQFVSASKEICARLIAQGYWADFIDPSSGKPYFGSHTPTTMFETDEKYRLLGFRIEDLGCCKVVCHREFGRHVFVGTIFTNAHTSTGVVEELFEDMKIALDEKQPGFAAGKK